MLSPEQPQADRDRDHTLDTTAAHAYDSRSKDGKALLKLAGRILPYLEEANLFKQFKLDEYWTATRTRSSSRAAEVMPRFA